MNITALVEEISRGRLRVDCRPSRQRPPTARLRRKRSFAGPQSDDKFDPFRTFDQKSCPYDFKVGVTFTYGQTLSRPSLSSFVPGR